jgi:hypothetical protein
MQTKLADAAAKTAAAQKALAVAAAAWANIPLPQTAKEAADFLDWRRNTGGLEPEPADSLPALDAAAERVAAEVLGGASAVQSSVRQVLSAFEEWATDRRRDGACGVVSLDALHGASLNHVESPEERCWLTECPVRDLPPALRDQLPAAASSWGASVVLGRARETAARHFGQAAHAGPAWAAAEYIARQTEAAAERRRQANESRQRTQEQAAREAAAREANSRWPWDPQVRAEREGQRMADLEKRLAELTETKGRTPQ